MQTLGSISYILTALLCFWADWRIGIAFITFYIAFKIELYDNGQSSNDQV